MESQKGVLVYGETVGNRLASITRELLGIGRKLADETVKNWGSFSYRGPDMTWAPRPSPAVRIRYMWWPILWPRNIRPIHMCCRFLRL